MVRDDYTSGRNEMGMLDPNAGNTAQEIFEGEEEPMATNGNQVRGQLSPGVLCAPLLRA